MLNYSAWSSSCFQLTTTHDITTTKIQKMDFNSNWWGEKYNTDMKLAFAYYFVQNWI